jgi:hypothetical protein
MKTTVAYSSGTINFRRLSHAYRGRGEVHTGFWWGNLKERDRLGDTGVDGRIILRWILRK